MMQDPNAAAAIHELREQVKSLMERVTTLEAKSAPNYFGMMGHKPECPIMSAAGNPKCTCGLL